MLELSTLLNGNAYAELLTRREQNWHMLDLPNQDASGLNEGLQGSRGSPYYPGGH